LPPPVRQTEERDARFFFALENGHPIASACRAAGYAVPSVYRWRAGNSAFATRWAEALTLAAELLEEEADRRGRDGFDEPVFHRGRQCGTKRRFSDGLLLARLKAVRPHDYRERYAPAASQPQRPVTVVVRDFDMEENLMRLLGCAKITLDDLSGRARETMARRLAERAQERSGFNDGH
jgi:hypothetical protein